MDTGSIKYRSSYFFIILFLILIFLAPLTTSPSFAQSSDFTIGNYLLVSQTRVGRTIYEYTYYADITNKGSIDATNVTATLTSLVSSITVIDGSLTFGDVPADATVKSTDTFKIRVDRSYPFSESYLVWDIQAVFGNHPPVANAGEDQNVMVGNLVTLDGRNSYDPDDDLITYKWTALEVPTGSSVVLNNPTSVMPSFVPDLPGNYIFTLTVNDSKADSSPDDVVVIAARPNVAPTANAGPDQSVVTGSIIYLNGTGSFDPDGDPLTYNWQTISLPAGSTTSLDDSTSPTPSFLTDVDGEYVFSLIVNDGLINSAPDDVVVISAIPNAPPVADAGNDQTVSKNTMISLDGTRSSDPDNDTLTYSWSIVSRPDGSETQFDNPNSPTPEILADKKGNYVFRLVVNDGELDSDPDTVVVTVVNDPPIADAGQDRGVLIGTTLNLDGSGSSDPNGDSLTYQWTIVSAPSGSGAIINNPTSVNPTFTPEIPGTYTIQLIVNDGQLDSSADTTTITVRVPVPNVIGMLQADAESAIIAAHLTVGTIITEHSSTVPAGNVISQNPAAGASVLINSSVALVISLGPQMIIVPDVVGMTQANAESFLVSVGLAVGTITTAYSDTVSKDYVISQNPVAGTSAVHGSTVDLVISLGPQSVPLPPDPTTVAPPVDRTVATTMLAATSFLYTGTNPIQTGVAPGTIEIKQAAVLRGKVLTRDGDPLPGVTITVLNHPEFGQTLSRADGMFDMAVNGGGYLTINYEKSGYLPSHRQVNVPWQDYAWLPDVALITLDTQVTTIDLTSTVPMQVARGSVMTDIDGTRQATLLFPQGTIAQMLMPDGSMQPLTSLNIRATEYTVGPNGPKAMPAQLPPTSAYTYAVELSADEALSAGAKELLFDRQVYLYVDDFIGFPVGSAVPSGYYDRQKGQWIPSETGMIIQILSITGGLADLDINGDGLADDLSTLDALNITQAERERLAVLYPYAPKQLWRVPVTHFSPYDCNWPSGPPPDATPPKLPEPEKDDSTDDPDCNNGSIIECQNQILGESIGITGTPFTLNYHSDRVPGNKKAYTLKIPVSGDTLPPSLRQIDLVISIAGRQFFETLPPIPNQSYDFYWDGKDAYGNLVQGSQPITVHVSYNYEPYYYSFLTYPSEISKLFAFAFMPGEVGSVELNWSPVTIEVPIGRDDGSVSSLGQTWKGFIGVWDAKEDLGGWALNIHHSYDPGDRILYLGNGGRRNAQNVGFFIENVAGNGTEGYSGDDGPATQARLWNPDGVAVGPDGSLYIADGGNSRIRRVSLDGIITTVAHFISPIHGVAVGPDGSIYTAVWGIHNVSRVNPDGTYTIIAGISYQHGYSGDGGPATGAMLWYPSDVALGSDGSLYIADTSNNRIRRVSPNGIITTVAGNGYAGYHGNEDGGLATKASLWGPDGVAVGPDGSLYIADTSNRRIRRVSPNGIITTVAGNGYAGYYGDGGPATQAALNYPGDVAVGLDGSLYIADTSNNCVRRVRPDGVITTVAGNGAQGYTGDNGPATGARLSDPVSVAVGPDAALYIDTAFAANSSRIRRVAPPQPGTSVNDIIISSEDGRELYVFDGAGRHLRTINTMTGATLYQFGYNAEGQLTTATDGDGNVTTIERDFSGKPTAVAGPFGQRTVLTIDTNGYLTSIANPAGEAYQFGYTDEGLMSSFTDPKGNVHSFTYDSLGLLTRDQNPAGGFLSLASIQTPSSSQVTTTSAMNRTSIYLTEHLPTDDKKRTNTLPTGAKSVELTKTDGTQVRTSPDGTVTTIIQGPDPRFGMQSPLLKSVTVTTPGGLVRNASENRAVNLADPQNPLSLTSLTDTITKNGQSYTSVYDASTRTFTNTTPAGRHTSTTIDSLGRISQSQIADMMPVNFTYDARGRFSNIAQGTRNFVFGYDQLGNLANVTDPLSRTVNFAYDLAGRVTTLTLPDGSQIQYSYDANGNVTSVTPPTRPSHAFNYTSVDLIRDYIPPDLGIGDTSTHYTYNIDKQLSSVTRPDGSIINLGYDSAGRPNTINYLQGTTSLSYDATTGSIKSITALDGGTITYAYDGSLLTDTTWAGAVSGSVHFTYDNNFRITSESVNGVSTVNFQYDQDGLLTQAGSLSLNRDSQNGMVTGSALYNVTDSTSYNNFGEVIAYQAAFGGAGIFSVNYDRDDLERIIQKSEMIDGTSHTYDYMYDQAGRLTVVTKDGVVVSQYVYDANGNRQSYTGSGGTISGTYDNQDRLLQYGTTTYGYTANGDLSTKTNGSGTVTYQYDAQGILRNVTLSDATIIEYLIDGQNRRIGKKVNGVIVQGFLYRDGLTPVAELDGVGNVISRFVYVGKRSVPEYMIKDGNIYRIVKDHLGSPRIVIDATTGIVAQRMDYDEFGKVIFDSNPGFQPFGFAGGLYDLDTRLVGFGARDYDAVAGRWTQKDPILFAGGDSNLYGYVHADPINHRDPSGNDPCAIVPYQHPFVMSFPGGGSWELTSYTWDQLERLINATRAGMAAARAQAPGVADTVISDTFISDTLVRQAPSVWSQLSSQLSQFLSQNATILSGSGGAAAAAAGWGAVAVAAGAGAATGYGIDQAYQAITGSSIGSDLYDAVYGTEN